MCNQRNCFAKKKVGSFSFQSPDVGVSHADRSCFLAYNKWHETELERWLSDHNVPYPTPADRKDLENLVKSNWESKIARPYNDWEPAQLQSYMKSKGTEAKKGTELSKDSLVNQVEGIWHESSGTATNSYHSVKDWIFDRSYVSLFQFEVTLC